MQQLPEDYVKGLEYIAYLAYNKGKTDERTGKENESMEKFLKIRVEEVRKMLSSFGK